MTVNRIHLGHAQAQLHALASHQETYSEDPHPEDCPSEEWAAWLADLDWMERRDHQVCRDPQVCQESTVCQVCQELLLPTACQDGLGSKVNAAAKYKSGLNGNHITQLT